MVYSNLGYFEVSKVWALRNIRAPILTEVWNCYRVACLSIYIRYAVTQLVASRKVDFVLIAKFYMFSKYLYQAGVLE